MNLHDLLQYGPIAVQCHNVPDADALAAGFALTDEWHQLSVPGRDGNLRDVLIDTAGAFTGAVLGCILTGLRRLLARLRGRKPAA